MTTTTTIETLLHRLQSAANVCVEIRSGLEDLLAREPARSDTAGRRIRLWFEILSQEAFAASDVREQWLLQATESGICFDFVARLQACLDGQRDGMLPCAELLELARSDVREVVRAKHFDKRTERQLDDGMTRFTQETARANAVRQELIEHAAQRIEILSRKMLRRSSPIVRGKAQTGDVFIGAAMRLMKALRRVSPLDPRAFFGLVSLQIRRELTDLARRGKSDNQPGSDLAELALRSADDPRNLECWTHFHVAVGRLPPEQKEVVCLHWYQGLALKEIAEVVRADQSTVKRRWRAARGRLAEELQECASVMLGE